MGTKAHKVKVFFVWFPINQNQIGLYMTISMVYPITGKGVVKIAVW